MWRSVHSPAVLSWDVDAPVFSRGACLWCRPSTKPLSQPTPCCALPAFWLRCCRFQPLPDESRVLLRRAAPHHRASGRAHHRHPHGVNGLQHVRRREHGGSSHIEYGFIHTTLRRCVGGELSEGVGMETYLHGSMDFEKTLELRLRVGDLDLREKEERGVRVVRRRKRRRRRRRRRRRKQMHRCARVAKQFIRVELT